VFNEIYELYEDGFANKIIVGYVTRLMANIRNGENRDGLDNFILNNKFFKRLQKSEIVLKLYVTFFHPQLLLIITFNVHCCNQNHNFRIEKLLF
jgi:hypothetical protein